MTNSKTVLTLILALGIIATGPIVVKSSLFASTAAHADGIGEDHDSDHGGSYDDDGEESDDDAGPVGAKPGPLFNEQVAPSQTCQEPACKDIQSDLTGIPSPTTTN